MVPTTAPHGAVAVLLREGGAPFGIIPSGGAPAGGVPLITLSPGGMPAGGVPFGIMPPGGAPAGRVPFGAGRPCPGSAGNVPFPGTAGSDTVPSGVTVDPAVVPVSAAGVAFELAVHPAMLAKQPRMATVARISRRVRELPPAVNASLFIYALFLVMVLKTVGACGRGSRPSVSPAYAPFPYWSNRCSVIMPALSRDSPPRVRSMVCQGSSRSEVEGSGCCPQSSFAVM